MSDNHLDSGTRARIAEVLAAHPFWDYEKVADEVNRTRPAGTRAVSAFAVAWLLDRS